MRIRQFFSTFFMLIFVSLIVGLGIQLLKPDVLPLGSAMPEIEFYSCDSILRLKPDSTINTLVVYFHNKCKYCRYQLKLFNDHINDFKDLKLYLLTREKELFKNQEPKKWPALSGAKNVFWGIVDRNLFVSGFGSGLTPSLYFFDKDGMLYNKIRGEVRFEKIASLKNVIHPDLKQR
jgi:hypothetical protein